MLPPLIVQLKISPLNDVANLFLVSATSLSHGSMVPTFVHQGWGSYSAPAAPTAYQRAGKVIQGHFMACHPLSLQEMSESHVLPDIWQCVMAFFGWRALLKCHILMWIPPLSQALNALLLPQLFGWAVHRKPPSLWHEQYQDLLLAILLASPNLQAGPPLIFYFAQI